jgi:hypothetical protein
MPPAKLVSDGWAVAHAQFDVSIAIKAIHSEDAPNTEPKQLGSSQFPTLIAL